MTKKWTVTVEEDPATGECFIQLPEEVLAAANWKENDTILWTDNEDGTWSLTKKE